ncbi:hypothetical protein ONS96_009353 [Cadophora gregata f. sp. sojae]|nr:hypothetical protein ONS96_009353 [Cadophora gregata f. sp. sojae]
MKNRGKHELITARAPIHASYNTVISNNVGQRHIFRESKEFTAAELDPPSDGNRRYLIVGYAPRSIPHDEYSTKNKAYGKHGRKTMGTTRPENVISWDEDTIPVLVVAGLDCKPGEGVKFWALLWQVDGLCTPFAIKNDSIFFRWEYRTLAVNLKAMKAAWIENVAKTIDKLNRAGDPDVHTSLDVCKTEPVSPIAKNKARRSGVASGNPRSNESQGGYQSKAPSSNNDSSRTFPDSRFHSQVLHTPALTFNMSPDAQKTSPKSQIPRATHELRSQANINHDDELIAPETLQAAKELQRIARQSLQAERSKLSADQASFTVKQAAIDKWRDSLTEEKRVFEQGLSFQVARLTSRERNLEAGEQRVYEREQHVKVRENDVKGREVRAEKWEERLRAWDANLRERSRISLERENVYQDDLARLKAGQGELIEREEAIGDVKRALDESVEQAMKALGAVQQSLGKRSVEGDREGRRKSKKQRNSVGC